VTETTRASGDPRDGDRLLAEILVDAGDDGEQLRALHRAIEGSLELPVDIHVVGEPLVLVAVEYEGNARRGLVARCRREDGSEHRIGYADVEMRAGTPGARHLAAYRAWLGVVPGPTTSSAAPRGRRQHKAGEDDLDLSRPVELVVLAVKERAARCRLLGTQRVITLRAGSLHRVVAGQIATVQPGKHWRHAGHPYLSGQIVSTRIDATALGLTPLALRPSSTGGPEGGRRLVFEMEVPVIEAVADDHAADDEVAARLLETDLRFLDAHALLGCRLLRFSPQWALHHYEVGVQIGELSIEAPFDGVLPWSLVGNRPILSCMEGYGSCSWRLGRWDAAERVFERVTRLDPTDHHDVRSRLSAVRAREPWSDEEARR
jgi:hypothetical protein